MCIRDRASADGAANGDQLDVPVTQGSVQVLIVIVLIAMVAIRHDGVGFTHGITPSRMDSGPGLSAPDPAHITCHPNPRRGNPKNLSLIHIWARWQTG